MNVVPRLVGLDVLSYLIGLQKPARVVRPGSPNCRLDTVQEARNPAGAVDLVTVTRLRRGRSVASYEANLPLDSRTMNHFRPGSVLGGNRPVALVSGLVLVASACISATLFWRPPRSRKTPYTLSPAKTVLAAHRLHNLPYPPDALPGARDVETPYGSIRVYEWGPTDGERVLFVHGISTPVVALGDLGHEMVARGYRVMMFGT